MKFMQALVGLVLLGTSLGWSARAQQWSAQYDGDVAAKNAQPAWFKRACSSAPMGSATRQGACSTRSTTPRSTPIA
jgi:hypothetical protein